MGNALDTSVINSHLIDQDSKQPADVPTKPFLRGQHANFFPGSRIQRQPPYSSYEKPLLSHCRSQIPPAPCQIPGTELKFSTISSGSKASETIPGVVG